MSSRFNTRATDPARSSLFSGYDAAQQHRSSNSSTKPGSPAPGPSSRGGTPTFAAYPSSSSSLSGAVGAANGTVENGNGGGGGAFRAATPNRRGQYSDAVLSELESQNDEQLGLMSAKVRMLKDITSAIGDEIRDSTALAEKMNDGFEGTRVRLRSTMNRMLRMAERTGVGWRAWVGVFSAVCVLFWYVWLF